MGQKTHPHGFRLGIVKDWKSRWYAERDFPRLLKEDETIRKYLHRRLNHAALSKVEIERKPSKIVVTLHTARPGVVIGKRGAEVDKLRDELAVLTKSEVSVNVEEIKRPEIDARLVAENVAHQIRQRISFRRAMKRAVQSAIRTGAEGIKTPDEAALYGGTAGEQYDPCYHLACDTFDNVSLEVLDVNSDAAAYAVLYYAMNSTP